MSDGWQGSEERGYRCTVAMQAKEKGMMAVMASFTPIFCLRHLALLQRREISKVAEPLLLRRNRKLPLRTRADLSASRIFRSNGWFLQRGVVAERRAMPARIMSGLEPRHREIVRREMLAWIPTDRFIRRLPAPTFASLALDGTEIARVVPLASRPRPFLLWKLTISRPQPR